MPSAESGDSAPPTIDTVDAAWSLSDATAAALSPTFAPFLPFFVRETFRTRGSVRVLRGAGEVAGVHLLRASEGVGTIFAADRASAERLFAARGATAAFAEHRLEPTAEEYRIYAASLEPTASPHRFRHDVRRARADDAPELLELMRGVYGLVDPTWFEAPPAPEEQAFVVALDGRLVGAAWVTVVGAHARLHSLSVAPRCRGLGIGADLVRARLWFAGQLGARDALSEIAASNVASCGAAERAGFRATGAIYEHCPANGRDVTSSAPRSSDRPSPSYR
jgi:ribosomal protein S18 acetylase RimI-like enzyme